MRRIGEISEKQYERVGITVNFESGSHHSLLLNGLNELRSKGQLLDVTLIAGGINGRKYEAHRVVLSACSDYFK